MKAKAKGPTPPLEIRLMFLGEQAETIRKAADSCGMIAAEYVRMLAVVCTDSTFQAKMAKMVSRKKFEAIGTESLKTANIIMARSKLKLVE